jgi:hypothetical protein
VNQAARISQDCNAQEKTLRTQQAAQLSPKNPLLHNTAMNKDTLIYSTVSSIMSFSTILYQEIIQTLSDRLQWLPATCPEGSFAHSRAWQGPARQVEV